MKIFVGVMHPKHVHMFKNLIWELEKEGNEVRIIANRKDITEELIKTYFSNYYFIGSNPDSILRKSFELVKWEISTLKYSLNEKPDIFIGQALPHFAHISFLLKKPYLIFEDTESANFVQRICFPFATQIITPKFYKKNHGKKHIKFNGFYELAYLSSKYFSPDPSILDKLALKKYEKYSVIRFISWGAMHDIGQKGIDDEEKIMLVKSLEQYGRVYITSEKKLPPQLEANKFSLVASEIHNLLYFANIYVGDSGTMATESALLGTPSIRYYSLSHDSLGNFIELEKKKLIYQVSDFEELKNVSVTLLSNDQTKEVWKQRCKLIVDESEDINQFMINLIKQTVRK